MPQYFGVSVRSLMGLGLSAALAYEGLSLAGVSGAGVPRKGSPPGTASFVLTLPCLTTTNWLVNTTRSSTEFNDPVTMAPVLLDVQCARPAYVGRFAGAFALPSLEAVTLVESTNIPDYSTLIDARVIANLDARDPNDFEDPSTGYTVTEGVDTVEFGQDIGFNGKPMCFVLPRTKLEGYGYWPPGPSCPILQSSLFLFPQKPKRAGTATECHTNAGAIGKWLNGVSMYNYWDAQSWDQDCNGAQDDVWHRIGPAWEPYDMDICQGHADGSGEYHHHSYPVCLGERLNDNGHYTSPILGYAADGYPVLGPWVGKERLALTCWKTRDYDTPGSLTGCIAPAGSRTCLLNTAYDYSKGIVPAAANGPNTADMVQTIQPCTPGATPPAQWRRIQAESGVFAEDYYWDQACYHPFQDVYLDVHNGHVARQTEAMEFYEAYHTILSGYHYHTTRRVVGRDDEGNIVMEDVFPYTVGPTFRGQVPTSLYAEVAGATVVQCAAPYPFP
jgi:hypothetical protein